MVVLFDLTHFHIDFHDCQALIQFLNNMIVHIYKAFLFFFHEWKAIEWNQAIQKQAVRTNPNLTKEAQTKQSQNKNNPFTS